MSFAMKFGIIALGGALGALGRTGMTAMVASLVDGMATPGKIVGTMAVNILGCFLMGTARSAVELAGWGTTETHAFLFSGFLGAFTTFSTFEANTITLWREGERLAAGIYMGGSVVGGLAAFLIGWTMLSKFAG
jgi:CrcB protein